ncbi:MAG: bifunctional phosphoglucose/phosphomannose isomerase [Chloroflexi bacterium]|nr:bifunctional phosphoglucose/phosphomannose isomerase [Chloroflexota bacterium]
MTLDDVAACRQLDPSHMLSRIQSLPEQCRAGWRRGMEFPLPPDYSTVNKVLLLGMGGSAMGGDLVGSLIPLEGKIPFLIHRDYGLPALVDDNTLVIASSYSGNTEETLDAFSQTLNGGAKKLVIAGGGKLRLLAQARSIPTLLIDREAEPRNTLGFTFTCLLALCQRLGLLPSRGRGVTDMVATLKRLSPRLSPDIPIVDNPAKQMALRLQGRLVVVYGAGFLAQVAHRWKTQLNENSKVWAFYETLPELNHNSVVGYPLPSQVKEHIIVVLLHTLSLHHRLLARYQVTQDLLEKEGIESHLTTVDGRNPLSQMMSAVMLGDFVSYYLALLNGVDPSPVATIDYLKERLARFQ